MFFDDNRIEILDPSVDYDELEKFAKGRGVPYYENDVASKWCAYAQKYGLENGLTYSEQLSFSYIISSIFGGMGFSCSTEAYYREEEIELISINKLNELRDSNLDESDVMKSLFNYIFSLYEDIEKYTYKTERISFKISLSMAERFEKIEGGSKSDKFRMLVQNYKRMG